MLTERRLAAEWAELDVHPGRQENPLNSYWWDQPISQADAVVAAVSLAGWWLLGSLRRTIHTR